MTAAVLLEILLKTESHNVTGCREYNKETALNLFNGLQNLPSLFPMPVALPEILTRPIKILHIFGHL